MTRSLISSLKAGPPPPRVVLLPDALFFVRAIPVPRDATPPEIASQVELALETLSPFPPAQLYHGYYWRPGGERALVYAAYRRRFTTEQADAWQNAELVIPAFASVLGGNGNRNTTIVLPSAEGLTAIYWDDQAVPARVAFRPVPPDALEADVTRLREELLVAAPRNKTIVLDAEPLAESSSGDDEMTFRIGSMDSRLPVAQTASMDVRDKEALANLRRSRRRDLVLWRTFLGLVAALVLLGLAELALIGADFWQRTRIARANEQRPLVERIMTAQTLTTRINELSTKRLLPFEMIAFLNNHRPAEVVFRRVSTVGLHAIRVEAYTSAFPAVSTFESALKALPECERVELTVLPGGDNLMTFELTATFRPDALKPDPNP